MYKNSLYYVKRCFFFMDNEDSVKEGEQISLGNDYESQELNAKGDVTSNNRLSVVSSESGKNSSESVEILSSTGCSTSPDSDVPSLGLSLSTSSSAQGIR